MPFPTVRRSDNDVVISGICSGIAGDIGVDPTLVRLLFVVLALAGGAGIALYGSLWAWSKGKVWWAAIPLLATASILLQGIGLSGPSIAGLALIGGGLILMWRRGRSLRPNEPLSLAGLVLVAAGAGIILTRGGNSVAILAPGAVIGALLLIAGPWLWQLAVERDAERAARIRADERSEVAARVHDSVLQTLALVQRHSDDPHRVATLARRQERELRAWLYGDGHTGGDSLFGALDLAAQEIEDIHPDVRVEIAKSGHDVPVDEAIQALVLAAREAMQNAAKFSGADEISVYAEVRETTISVFVRDRGAGFDRTEVPGDRRGLSESIEARMTRSGGTAPISSTVGEGTEVELTLPLGGAA